MSFFITLMVILLIASLIVKLVCLLNILIFFVNWIFFDPLTLLI